MRVQRTVKHRLSSIDASSGRPDWPELPGLLETGIEALDRVLPKGIPRNTMMILAGELGTGKSVLMGELFFNILKKRKEPCIFFFQAEDGIRDLTVTGVQTCALPI